MKYLLVIILENENLTYPLIKKLNEKDIHGTVIPTTNMKNKLLHGEDEPLPSIGGLRHIVKPSFQENTTLLLVLKEETLEIAKQATREVTENFKDDCGKMFALPLMFSEGHIA